MTFLLLVLLTLIGNGAMQEPAEDCLALVHVNVIPMDAEEGNAEEVVLEDHAVLVRAGRIAAVVPTSELELPAGCQVVEGKGRYLVPGLVDMHVHVQEEEELLLNVAAGVTSVRNLWGLPMHLSMQARVEAGSIIGPTVYTTGPITDGVPPAWDGSIAIDDPDAAYDEVLRQKEAGFEAIKVYSLLSEDVYVALLDAAHELDLRVTGHVPSRVGIRTALEIGQDCIEHLEGYFPFSGAGPGDNATELIELTVDAGTWNCVTLVVIKNISRLGGVAELKARPEMRYVNPRTRASWDPAFDWRFRNYNAATFGLMKGRVRAMQAFVQALHEGGGGILAGTDTPNPYVVPGFALHDELALLVEAGLSEHDALRAATAQPARYLGRVDEFGRIVPGLRADLLLLENNPLEDIAHTRERAGVVLRGRWLPQDELERRLEELAASFEQEVKVVREHALDLPDEGEAWLEGRYEQEYNGVVVGAERVAVRRAGEQGYVVLARAASTGGFEAGFRQELDRNLHETSFTYHQKREGRELRLTGRREAGRMTIDVEPEHTGIPGEIEVDERTLSNLPTLGSLQLLALRLQELAPGGEWRFTEFEIGEDQRVVTRENVARALKTEPRAFRIESRSDSRVVVLTTDARGRLLDARIELQIGEVQYAIVKE